MIKSSKKKAKLNFSCLLKLKLLFVILYFQPRVFTTVYMDASHPWQTGFQDPATPIMEGIIFFNALLMSLMICIACLVGWLLYQSLTLFKESSHATPVGFSHSTWLEVVWTLAPAITLMVISIPSYSLLYSMDEVIDPSITIKVVGHQWYWSYECSDFEKVPKDQMKFKSLSDAIEWLRHWNDIIESARVETKAGEKQTQVSLLQEFLSFLDDNLKLLKNSPEEKSKEVLLRLYYTLLLLLKHESIKETHMVRNELDYNTCGEMGDILFSIKEKLEKASLLPKQKELLVKVIKTFKESLRVTKDEELESTKTRIIHLLSDFEGSDNDKTSDGKADDDDGSIVADLIAFDKSAPYWQWCEYKSVKDRYDYDNFCLRVAAEEARDAELLCNDAALMLDDGSIPFPELLKDYGKKKKVLKEIIAVESLSEDVLIDTQLIDHQLRLTRAEREGLSSEFALNKAVVASNFSKVEYNNALSELNNSNIRLGWANVEVAAANVNLLTAKYFQADVSLIITDPHLLRGVWININGYYSWTRFLRLVAKDFLEEARLEFLTAAEELNGANYLLSKLQKNLTPEKLEKSNSIADNAKAEFLLMEEESIPGIIEVRRGKVIVENAELELKAYHDILDRAKIRSCKAKKSFDEAKAISNRTQAKLKAAESFFKKALVDTGQVLSFKKDSLDLATSKFENLKDDFNKAVLGVQTAKLDLLVAQKRLRVVKINLEKTVRVFEDTGLLDKQTPVDGKPIEYYDNLLWEIHKEDVAFVEAQLKEDEEKLRSAFSDLEKAEKELTRVSGEIIDFELLKNKARLDHFGDTGTDINKELFGIELTIAESIYNIALANLELENSEKSYLILDRAFKGLIKVNSTKGSLSSVLENHINGIDSNKLVLDYAESCLTSTKKELDKAESDYAKAGIILDEAKLLLDIVAKDLSKDYDNPYLNTLRTLHKKTFLSFKNRVKELNFIRTELSPLDIKLNPGLLQFKSYREVLLAKAELANIKWLCARVAKTLDIPLSEKVRPFNLQFPHLKVDDSSSIDKPFGENDDTNIPKDPISPNYSSPSRYNDIVTSLLEVILSSSDEKQKELLTNMLREALELAYKQEVKKNQAIKEQIKSIKETVSTIIGTEEGEERPRINFDSYLITEDDLIIPEASVPGKAGTVFRLLEVDNRLVVPTNTHIRLLVTSADVLHSWAVPSLGIKVDACPGRLNQVFLFVKREGTFYGQCSELCGVNHGFMPIAVQAVSQDKYLSWVEKRLCF